jgi:hypothetical protein
MVLVLMGQREGVDLDLESMGLVIDHEGLDTRLARWGLKFLKNYIFIITTAIIQQKGDSSERAQWTTWME